MGKVGTYLTPHDVSIPGSLADREHRKWEEKTVPLSHNPYSMENIGRRRTMSFAGEEAIVSLRSQKNRYSLNQ